MKAAATITALLLALAALAPAAWAQDELAGQAVHQMEVVGDSEFRLEVEKTELDFHPTAMDLDEGATEEEAALFQYSPPASFHPYLYDSERVECPLVPDFAGRPVSRAPVVSFRTDFSGGADVVRWNLDITDYRGEVFRSMDGKRLPPGEMSWDGRGDHGEILKPGFPYSFLFTIEDSGTNRYQYAGNTFSLPFICYQEGKNLRVEAAAHALFEKGRARPLAEAPGRVDRILREILDSPRRAVQVDAWAETEALAAVRAAWLAEALETRLLLAKDQVAATGHAIKGDPPGRDGLLRVTLLKGGKQRD